MKVSEDELRKTLLKALENANGRGKPFIDQIKTLMFDMYGVTAGRVVNILNTANVGPLQNDEMFKITKVLYELNERPDRTFDYHKLDVEEYFFEREIQEFGQKISEDTQEGDIVIKAGNWFQVDKDHYVFTTTMDDLMSDYINVNKTNYNIETQRAPTVRKTRTGKVLIVTFFKKAFESICGLMDSGMYISDMLALSVDIDKYAPPSVVRGNLVIPAESKIDCIDGYHRLKSAVTVRNRNPNWNKKLVFSLFTFDKEKANQYILQEDYKNHLSDNQATKIDLLDAASFIIDKLNDSMKFILRNTIDESKSFSLNKIITTIFDPKKLYGQDEKQEAVALYSLIEKNIDNLIEQKNLFKTEFTKEVWFIYLYVLKYCVDNNKDFIDTVEKLPIDNLLNQIQFAKQPVKGDYKLMKGVMNNV